VREVLQKCKLVVGEAKRFHGRVRFEHPACSFPRAIASARRAQKRASIRMSCSRV
jgi:hypothetical protein